MQKKGISLIVLVITIIVLIILAASVVISLSNTGIINKASHAVQLTDESQVQDLAALIWAECYMDLEKKENIVTFVREELKKQGITEDNWEITITESGVAITSKKNEYNSEELNPINVKITDDKYEKGDYIYEAIKEGNRFEAETLEEAKEIAKAEIIEYLGVNSWEDVLAYASQQGITEEEYWESVSLTEATFVPYKIVGWNVKLNLNKTDKNKTIYGVILESINNLPILSLCYTFSECTNLLVAPKMPKDVVDISGAFSHCTALVTAPKIPAGVKEMTAVFAFCESLKQYEGNVDGDGDFSNYIIPENVSNLYFSFNSCNNMKKAPKIPRGIKTLAYTFTGCQSLTGTITIDATPEYFSSCFGDINFSVQNLNLLGNSANIDELGQTGVNYCTTCNGKCNGSH